MKKETKKTIFIVLAILAVAYLLLNRSNSKFGSWFNKIKKKVNVTTPPPTPPPRVNINDIYELFVTTIVLKNNYYGEIIRSLNIYNTPYYPIDKKTSINRSLYTNNTPVSIGFMKYGNPVKFYIEYYSPGYTNNPFYRFIEFNYNKTFIPKYENKPPNASVKIINKKIFVNITDPLLYNSDGSKNFDVIQARADIYIDVILEYTDDKGVKTYETENVKIMST